MILPPITLLLIVLIVCFTVLGSLTAVAIAGGLGLAWEVFRAFVAATLPEPDRPAERIEDEFA